MALTTNGARDDAPAVPPNAPGRDRPTRCWTHRSTGGLVLSIVGPVDLKPYVFLIGLMLILAANVVILTQSRRAARDRP